LVSNNFYLVRALTGQGKTYLTLDPQQLTTHWVTMEGAPAMINYLDPFGVPYNYYCTFPASTQQVNQGTFDLMSYGPDTSPKNKDDISNFQR
jgi:hypothetical protein